jgi:hypothetical protein
MAGWRDVASAEAQEDLDGLLNVVLPFATQCLDKRGELAPYGATVDRAGAVSLEAMGEAANSVDMLRDLTSAIRARRDDLRAVALVADVTTPDGDAVRVELEHRDGIAIVVLLPYRKRRFGRGIEYGDLVGAGGEPQVWPPSDE